MALVVQSSPQAGNARSGPEAVLQIAIQDFKEVLTKDEREKLNEFETIPSPGAVMQFTAKLDADQKRRGKSIGSRVFKFLETVGDFIAGFDTLVSSHPELAGLIWGSVKLTVILISNYTSYFDQVSNLLMSMSRDYPTFEDYRILFPTSTKLQEAICNFHASVIDCCKHLIEVLRRTWMQSIKNAFTSSFEIEFQPDKVKIEGRCKQVREAIRFATAEANIQNQQLQKKENRRSRARWRKMTEFMKNSTEELENASRQRDRRESGDLCLLQKRKKDLLKRLSSYDYTQSYLEACRKRYANTADWVFLTSEFQEWMHSPSSSILWLSGKSSAHAISHIARIKGDDEKLTYFFIRYEDPNSLKAETILQSIIRQSQNPDPASLSEEMERRLVEMKMDTFSNLDAWLDLLGYNIMLTNTFFLIVDAVDECEPQERRALLQGLSKLATTVSGFKVILTGRDSLSKEMKDTFPCLARVIMTPSQTEPDIVLYIDEVLQERQRIGELQLYDRELFGVIKNKLIHHANGMFLWVAYLIDELCCQDGDEDIKSCLETLPKDLTELFHRAITRIYEKGANLLAKEVFTWIVAAKRCLHLDDLDEGLFVDIGRFSLRAQPRFNIKDRLESRCENLLSVDEEYATIQFPHRTIYDFLTGDYVKGTLPEMYIDPVKADHYLGEICVTYLHLNDFVTTLARRDHSSQIDPLVLASTALHQRGRIRQLPRRLLSYVSEAHNQTQRFDLRAFQSYGKGDIETLDSLYQAHPFLTYASVHWISHSSRFIQDQSSTWQLWKRMVTEGHELAQRPWLKVSASSPQEAMTQWAYQARHFALLRLRECHEATNSCMLVESAALGDLELVELLLEAPAASIGVSNRAQSEAMTREIIDGFVPRRAHGSIVKDEFDSLRHGIIGKSVALQGAAGGGHLEVVNLLLAAEADATSADALQAAAGGGHLEVVNRLLDSGADVNAAAALRSAAGGGHLEVVNRLLDAEARVNIVSSARGGLTALQAAAAHGHLEVVNRLLDATADINPAAALQSAARGGHLEVVDRLLDAEAYTDVVSGAWGCLTALKAAAGCGHLEVVNRLLDAKANINPATALHSAAGGGHLRIVNRLLDAGADANATADAWGGLTALQTAAACGHLEVVNRLIDVKADVNAKSAPWSGIDSRHRTASNWLPPIIFSVIEPPLGGLTALHAAAACGHLAVVYRLLAEKADASATTSYNSQTALDLAIERGHFEISKILTSNTQLEHDN
ncbi:unnamed protein product [Clonostachys rosea]|uniref:NACHT domain-containing protein n=1 Tax=Bionectria ochroleuca TaxID=29856 RepID=A0ABY6U4J3_BIOOC|nr:unnamed protein product [Clonostachys rosea]